MKCSDLQFNLSLYSDGLLGDAESGTIATHLAICPLCRQASGEIRDIRAGLRQISRPEISAALRNSLKSSVRLDLRSGGRSWLPFSADMRDLLQMRVMPYGVGVFASVIIGFTFLTMMFSGMLRPGNAAATARGGNSTIMLATNSSPFSDQGSAYISPSDFAQTRLGYGSESPSINPQGALIALTKSLVRGGMKDDEVVVVADVFGNGLAQIAEVIEPSRDSRAVIDLQRALESDPAYAAFVPTNIESRPESVRVVLKFQSVNVRTGERPVKSRR